MNKLRLLDTFSGIGGFSYAAEVLVGGYQTVQFVEREPFCQQILHKHWPDVPIHDDIITFEPSPGSADVVVGGFPCQDISHAGKGAGIKEGTRSGLFHELMRVVRLVQPQYVVLENVAAILANGLDTVLGELAEAGFDAEWACIPASAVGACHHRDRWWLVAYANSRRQSQQGVFLSTEKWSGDRMESFSVRGSGSGQNTINVAHANNTGSQGQRPECQLPESGGQGTPAWRGGGPMLSPKWEGHISKPVLCRGDDGLSGRVDRLKALGNAVVPQVAAIPLMRVLELAQRQP